MSALWATVRRVALAFIVTAAAAAAQDKNPDTVVVQTNRAELQKRLFDFVTRVTHSAPSNGSLRRWIVPVCPLTAGLAKDPAEFVLARISTAARDASVPLAPEKCQPNFYVVVTQDPEGLIKGWLKRDPRAFGDVPDSVTRTFVEKSRPVRVWYNVSFRGHDGVPLTPGGTFELGTALSAPTNKHATDSRLTLSDVTELGSVMVVVDLKSVAGLQFGQLADYIAMVGLSEVSLDADLGAAPSVLQLFAKGSAPGPASPQGLTVWDQAFLKALYTTQQASVMQRSEITHAMLESVDH